MANIRFQNALKNVTQDTPPIWFMRQAGRYHSHYQNLRAKHDFVELCKNPELASEVAMGPVQDFDFDLAILFSDLLFPLEALGMNLFYDPGPKFEKALTRSDLKAVLPLAEALPKLEFQKTAMQLTRQKLPSHKSLIGFVGGPWTLFSYAVQEGHDGNLVQAKTQLEFFADFCEVMIPLLIENIKLQLDGGAEVVMVLDTAAGELSPLLFKDVVTPQNAKLAKAFPGKLGYYSKTTHVQHVEGVFADKNWGGFGVDHRHDVATLLKNKKHGFLQGNFDQALLFGDTDSFIRNLENWIEPIKRLSPEERAGWVCGLGHGILPKTPEKHVKLFVQHIRETFRK